MKYFNLRIIGWITLYILAAHRIGELFDYSFIALLVAIGAGIFSVVLSFPEFFESNRNNKTKMEAEKL